MCFLTLCEKAIPDYSSSLLLIRPHKVYFCFETHIMFQWNISKTTCCNKDIIPSFLLYFILFYFLTHLFPKSNLCWRKSVKNTEYIFVKLIHRDWTLRNRTKRTENKGKQGKNVSDGLEEKVKNERIEQINKNKECSFYHMRDELDSPELVCL